MNAIRKLVLGIIGVAVIGLAVFLVWWFAIKSDP